MRAKNTNQILAAILPLTFLSSSSVLSAQNCSSTGADGAYAPPATTTVFDPVQAGLNAAGDNVFNFTSLTINSGVSIRMLSHLMKSQRPVVFLVSGPVVINGTLDLSGTAGPGSQTIFEYRTPSEPGPGGYPGGVGARPNTGLPGAGAGPGGGRVPTNNGVACSASYAAPGPGGSGCTAAPTCECADYSP